jgi:hypothetical protein
MNIEYTENTKYVEDIVRKYITDPEDCDTVIWCLQKMHIDIDSLVAMLHRKDEHVDHLYNRIREMYEKYWLLKQDKAVKAADGITLNSKIQQCTFKLPCRIHVSDRSISFQKVGSSEVLTNCTCEQPIRVVVHPTNEVIISFSNQDDYDLVKQHCEQILENNKSHEVSDNE